MLRTLAYATFSATALAGSSASPRTTRRLRRTSQPQAQAPSGVTFVTPEESQRRAPKLVGVGVYGPDDKQIGKIDDLLMDHNGAAQTVVIGVGGFLGFGKKDVAVPFSALQWRTEARNGASSRTAGRRCFASRRDKRPTAPAADEGNESGCCRSEPGLSRQGGSRRDAGGTEGRA